MTPAAAARPLTTLPALLLAHAQERGQRIAIREKEYGIWQSYTWAESLERVQALAVGLARLGFGRGDRLAIVGDNRPELYWALLAAETLGGIPVPVYQDATATELRYAIAHAGARIVVAEDQEQVDKILEVRADLPTVEHVLYEDPKGLRHYVEPVLRALDAVFTAGREADGGGPAAFRALVERLNPEDTATGIQ